MTAITGGVKFFSRNKAIFGDGATASASTNDESAKFMLAISRFVRWESLASNDLTTETIVITLPAATTIGVIFIASHNLKDFDIKYNAAQDFTNVSGIDGDLVGGIVETAFVDDTAYYTFDPVSVTSITITANKTQIVDAQKFITFFMATTELGTLAGFPRIQKVRHSRNIKSTKVLSGKGVIQKSHETTSFEMRFKTHPIQADITLLETLYDREESFLVWLCGGRRGTDFFTIEQKGWRLRDVYNMQSTKALGADYEKSIYQNGVNSRMSLIEVT